MGIGDTLEKVHKLTASTAGEIALCLQRRGVSQEKLSSWIEDLEAASVQLRGIRGIVTGGSGQSAEE